MKRQGKEFTEVRADHEHSKENRQTHGAGKGWKNYLS